MSTQDNVQLVRSLFQAMDSGKTGQIQSFLAPNAEFTIFGMGEPISGAQQIQEGFDHWRSTFPDMKTEIVNTCASDDSVVVEYVSRGTHQGPLEGHEGKVLQPTQRKIEVPGCDVYRVSNGKIVSAHIYFQSMIMLKQLGAFEGMKAAA